METKEITEIIETINEQEFKDFVRHFWQEKWQLTKDFDTELSTGLTYSSFKCYKRLVPEMQVIIEQIGSTPSEFVRILRAFLTDSILSKTSTVSSEAYDIIGLPDLLDDYYKIIKKNKIDDIIKNFTDEETEKLLEELCTVGKNSTYSHFTFFGNLSQSEQSFWEKSKPVEHFVEGMRWIFTRDTIKRLEHLTIEELDPLPMKELIEVFKMGMEIQDLQKQIDVIVAGTEIIEKKK